MSKEIQNELVQAMFRLKKMMNRGLGRDLDNANITMSEFILMREVAENTKESYNPMALTEVREYLSVSKAAVSQMLNSLEKRGYLTREIDVNNRRNIIVILTEVGKEVYQKKNQDFYDRFEKVIQGIGETDISHFIAMINKMADAMGEQDIDEE